MTQLDVRLLAKVAIKPEILRIHCYTIDTTTNSTRDYEITIHTNQFTRVKADGSIEVDLDVFRDYISREIIAIRDTAELAHVLNQADLQWTIDVHALPIEEKSLLPDKKLAYGAKTE